MSSKKISLRLLEISRPLGLQLLLVRLKPDSSLVCGHLTSKGPSSWLSLKSRVNIDFVGRLGKLATESAARVVANFASVVSLFLVKCTKARCGSRCAVRS